MNTTKRVAATLAAAAPEGYTRITWPEVRKGDVLMHENGDRLTVLGVKPQHNGRNISVTSASLDLTSFGWAHRGWTAHRKVVTLPTTPGAYHDEDGEYWLLDRSGNWYDWSHLNEPGVFGGSPQNYAPFTRLVPMPSSDAVLNAIGAPEMLGHRTLTDDQVAAVMALLGDAAAAHL